jgi:hypothetical protein
MPSTERIQVEVELKRAALAEICAELAAVHKELDTFALQYNRVIGPLETQLDDILSEIETLQGRKKTPGAGDSMNFDGAFGEDYVSVEAQFRRAMDPNAPPAPKLSEIAPAPRAVPTAGDIRSVYRELARKYHPDTTTDLAEKARLNVIMAQINAAYRAKDTDELYRLADRKPEPVETPKPEKVEDRGPTTFAEWQALFYKLDEEIAWARSEKLRIVNGPLMKLKIEWSMQKSRGRDLLQDIAARVRSDVETATAELRRLQRVSRTS